MNKRKQKQFFGMEEDVSLPELKYNSMLGVISDTEKYSKWMLNNHVKKQTSKKPYQCKQCNHKAINKHRLKQHLLVHSTEKSHHCKQCDYKAVTKHRLQQHLLVHVSEKPHHCKQCDYKAVTKHRLQQHLLVHVSEKHHRCKQCDYKTTNKYRLKQHQLVHIGETYDCQHCNYNTINKYCLKQHVLVHTVVKPYCCNDCDYRTANKYHLKQHLLGHTNQFHHCTECNYRTTNKYRLTQHLKVHSRKLTKHDDYKPRKRFSFKLPTDDSPFRCRLREKKVEKVFQCEECHYQTTIEPDLQSHVMSHINFNKVSSTGEYDDGQETKPGENFLLGLGLEIVPNECLVLNSMDCVIKEEPNDLDINLFS